MPGLGLDTPQGIPRGHGRRHSVNVFNNKSTGPNASISYPNPYAQDTFDDTFIQPQVTAHSRQASRAESTWRMSEFHLSGSR